MNVAIKILLGKRWNTDEARRDCRLGRLLSLLDAVNAMAGHCLRKTGPPRAAKWLLIGVSFWKSRMSSFLFLKIAMVALELR